MNKAESNETIMKQFEIMINTADEALSQRLISEKASFFTPASPVPLYGGKGYMCFCYSTLRNRHCTFSTENNTIKSAKRKPNRISL